MILAVGNDSVVLATRTAVLRTAGYLVDTVESASEAIARFHNGDFDLVLICHSVPTGERDWLTRVIRSTGSRTPILVVSPFSDARGLADEVISNHPQKMLESIESALQRAAARYPKEVVVVRGDLRRLKRPTVLCIDHDSAALKVRRLALERSGFNVLTSTSSREGLNIFSTGLPEAVILEYTMPEMDGGAVASEMRQIRNDTSLILHSACTDIPEEVIRLFDYSLPKASSPYVLAAALAELLSVSAEKKVPVRVSAVRKINAQREKAG